METTKKVATSSEIFSILIENIVIETPNVRESYPEEAFQTLKESIRTNGVVQPLQVRKKRGTDEYILVHGYNRLRAVKELKSEGSEMERLKVLMVQFDRKAELFNHIVSNSGQPLTSFEISNILKEMETEGVTIEEMTTKTGFTPAKIKNLLLFQNHASEEVKEAVKKGELGITTAAQLVHEEKDKTKQDEALKQAKTGKKEGDKIRGSELTKKDAAIKAKVDFEKTFNLILLEAEKLKSPHIQMLSTIKVGIENGLSPEFILGNL